MIGIIRTRPPFALIEHEPYRALQWTELFPDRKFCWLTNTPDKIYKRFGRENFPLNLETCNLSKYYRTKSFKEKEKELNSIIKEKQITELVIVQNDLKLGFKHGDEGRFGKLFQDFYNKDTLGTFASIAHFLNHSFVAKHLTGILPWQHIYIDPQEGCWDALNGKQNCKGRYMFYGNPRIGADYFPSSEWTIFKDLNLNRKNKTRDFVFGYTVKTPDRVPLYEELNKIKGDKIDFLVWYPKLKIKTVLKRSEYLKMISESKWTLNTPSYEVTDFSSIRFWESLARGCISLVLNTCNWEQAFVEFPEIGEIIKSDLIVAPEEIAEAIQNLDYDLILDKIINTRDWQNLQNKEWYIQKAKIMESRFSDTDRIKVRQNGLF